MSSSPAFAPGVSEHLGHYVYLLFDPRTRDVFYVGVGTEDQWQEHLAAAGTLNTADSKPLVVQQIRSIQAAGEQVEVEILRHGMNEATAHEVRAAAIDLLGVPLPPMSVGASVAGRDPARGRSSVQEVSDQYDAQPVTIGRDSVVLLRVDHEWHRRVSDEALYEATRGPWTIAEHRREIGAGTTYALAIFKGIVRAAYAIEAWEPVPTETGKPPRWSFTGRRDPDVEARYVGKNVSTHLTSKGFRLPHPVIFVN